MGKIGVAYGAVMPVVIEVSINVVVCNSGDIFIDVGQDVRQMEPVKPYSAF